MNIQLALDRLSEQRCIEITQVLSEYIDCVVCGCWDYQGIWNKNS